MNSIEQIEYLIDTQKQTVIKMQRINKEIEAIINQLPQVRNKKNLEKYYFLQINRLKIAGNSFKILQSEIEVLKLKELMK